MVVVSYSGKEINAKLVYYGPGLSGKTTNLEFIYDSVPSTHRGKMVSMKTRTERTLFFDFLPIDLGEMAGFKTRFLLYTVPGQVYYNATRKLVLRGVDAVVFVADSGRGKMNENLESLENLRENLREYGMDIDQVPWVIQYNKRDIPDAYTIEELNEALNPGGQVPWFEAVATDGTGVFETFKGISKILLEKLSREIKTPAGRPAGASSATSAPAQPAPSATTPSAPAAAPAMPIGRSTATAASPAAPAAAAPVTPVTARPNHSAPGVVTKLPETAGSISNSNPNGSADDAEHDQKMTLGQRISRFFRKGSGESAAPPASTATPIHAAPTLAPVHSVASPAPVLAASTPVSQPAAAPVIEATPSPKPATRPAPVAATPHLARVDRPESSGAFRGESDSRPAVLEKKVRVPVQLSAEEVREGVTVKLILEVEVTTTSGSVEKTGTL